MAKFLFVYRNSADQEAHQPSPEEMQAIMGQWGEWFQKLGDSLVDGGDALLPTGSQVAADGTVTDGPFIEAKELVGGFSIVQADNYAAAVEMAKSCPVIANGGSVEVRETAGYADSNPQ